MTVLRRQFEQAQLVVSVPGNAADDDVAGGVALADDRHPVADEFVPQPAGQRAVGFVHQLEQESRRKIAVVFGNLPPEREEAREWAAGAGGHFLVVMDVQHNDQAFFQRPAGHFIRPGEEIGFDGVGRFALGVRSSGWECGRSRTRQRG